jgi:hypothetical protein
MEMQRKSELIKRRAVAKASLTCVQIYISGTNLKISKVKVRFDKLPSILSKFESTQDQLECMEDTDHSLDRIEFETQYCQVEAKFSEVLHPVLDALHSRDNSTHSSSSKHSQSGHSSRLKFPTIQIPVFSGQTVSWLSFRHTIEVLIVNNNTLSNVQKFHYLVSSLKDEARNLIANFQITNENFLVEWQLIAKEIQQKRLISIMHAKNLCNLPEVKKANSASCVSSYLQTC